MLFKTKGLVQKYQKGCRVKPKMITKMKQVDKFIFSAKHLKDEE